MVVFLFGKQGFFTINYLDDLGLAEKEEDADTAYAALLDLLHQIGLKESPAKCVPPCTVMVFLGIEVNTVLLLLKILHEKWCEIVELVKKWLNKREATLNEVQQLAGALNFACRCVCSGRIYLSRILNYLREFGNDKLSRRMVTAQVKEDVKWWAELAHMYNGVSLMNEIEWSVPDQILSSELFDRGRRLLKWGE